MIRRRLDDPVTTGVGIVRIFLRGMLLGGLVGLLILAIGLWAILATAPGF